jgi:hypothetical protein
MLTKWLKLQNVLLDLECETEISQLTEKISSLSPKECQNVGLSILNLQIDESKSAMFGRCSISLRKTDKSPIQSSFKVGDEVCLYNSKLKSQKKTEDVMDYVIDGLVSRVSMNSIQIIVEEFDDNNFESPLRLDIRTSQKTHLKMKEALSQLEKSSHPLVEMLFTPRDEPLLQEIVVQKVELLNVKNQQLNESQLDAICCTLGSPLVSIIHGPVSLFLFYYFNYLKILI